MVQFQSEQRQLGDPGKLQFLSKGSLLEKSLLLNRIFACVCVCVCVYTIIKVKVSLHL